MGTLTLVSGPSGVGKGPARIAVERFRPDIANRMKRVVLYTSRAIRPKEVDDVDYHFRLRTIIESLPKESHIVFPVHNDLQALSMDELNRVAGADHGIGYLEIFHAMAKPLAEQLRASGVEVRTVFISPLNEEEARGILTEEGSSALHKKLTDIMMRKIAQRTLNQDGALLPKDLTDILKRAGRAFEELQSAPYYDYVIPNHAGEDDLVWTLRELTGDALRTMQSMASILTGGGVSAYYEKWDPQLFENAKGNRRPIFGPAGSDYSDENALICQGEEEFIDGKWVKVVDNKGLFLGNVIGSEPKKGDKRKVSVLLAANKHWPANRDFNYYWGSIQIFDGKEWR